MSTVPNRLRIFPENTKSDISAVIRLRKHIIQLLLYFWILTEKYIVWASLTPQNSLSGKILLPRIITKYH